MTAIVFLISEVRRQIVIGKQAVDFCENEFNIKLYKYFSPKLC